jgi:hypothetical protein
MPLIVAGVLMMLAGLFFSLANRAALRTGSDRTG